MALWTKDRDDRPTQQIKDATQVLAKSARQLRTDTKSTPGNREIGNLLHDSININLDELERRGDL